jgi:hypothetical protein
MLTVALHTTTLVAVMWWAQRTRAPAYRRLIEAMRLHDPGSWEMLGRPDGSGWDFTHASGWRTPFDMYLKKREYDRAGAPELSAAGDAYRRFEFRTGPAAIVCWLALSVAVSELVARALA